MAVGRTVIEHAYEGTLAALKKRSLHILGLSIDKNSKDAQADQAAMKSWPLDFTARSHHHLCE
jgi:hypothetical protein